MNTEVLKYDTSERYARALRGRRPPVAERARGRNGVGRILQPLALTRPRSLPRPRRVSRPRSPVSRPRG